MSNKNGPDKDKAPLAIRIVKTVCMAGLVLCLLALCFYGLNYLKSLNSTKEIAAEYTEKSSVTLKEAFAKESSEKAPAAEEEKEEKALLSSFPVLTVKHDALYAENSDYRGWIDIPDTAISYPFYKSKDNADYVRRDEKGSYSYGGVIFIDGYVKDSSVKGSSSYKEPETPVNIVLHGHNMRMGTMFAGLKDYLTDGFISSHPFIIIYPNGCAPELYRIYSVYVTTAKKADKLSYTSAFNGRDSLAAFVDETAALSSVDTGYLPAKESTVLTLSTCYGASGSGKRLIVHAEQVISERKTE